VNVGLLLVSQDWVEKGVDEMRVRDFFGHDEEGLQKSLNLKTPLFRHLLDVCPAHMHASR